MRNMRNWMLGAAVVASGLGAGSAPAQAAEFGVYARGPAAYLPPCPGPGYVWMAGYDAGGYWIPGRWAFAGDLDRFAPSGEDWGRGWGGEGDRRRDFDRRFDRDRGRDRDRNWDRDRDREHFRR
jgi:hypothetical protein